MLLVNTGFLFSYNFRGFAKWVRLGELDHSSTTDNTKHEDYTIIERINHPEYNPPQMYNDIALYKVDLSLIHILCHCFFSLLLSLILFQQFKVQKNFLIVILMEASLTTTK